ncbi:hypothetical protein [Microcoleus vaginatus]|uniref:hypothetical protein n=1 Tax=Microcoleus vaginatus TaxID=119532 RepID=UPI0032AB5EA9
MNKASVPPLLVNGYAKTKLVPPRFKKDDFAVTQAFRSRARFFSLLEAEERLKRLDQPRLISSLHGQIEQILLTIPSWVFFPENSPDETSLIQKYADAFRRILQTLPTNTKFLILINEISQDRLTQWTEEFGITERTEIVTTDNTTRFTVWAQDAYCVCDDKLDNEKYFVEPASFNRADDAYIADRVATKTNLESTQVQLYFQGGNILIGDDFWFIGADYPENSLDLGFVIPAPGESDAKAIARVYGNYLDKSRKLIVVGSRLPVPSQRVRPITINGESWQEILYFGNNKGTVQPLFHIDMFISLAGRSDSGKYRVLVADPAMAASILGEPLPEGAMQDVFDDIASSLSEIEFEVIRNPMPMAYDDDDIDKVRYWYFATGNNVIIQDTPKKVWLPTYGHDQWSKLSLTDQKNKEIWESLGYSVEMLPNFHPFAANLGAAHCITKYLYRM